ncbi:MAG: lipoprotein insertase outer membrane protein LolB [Burkholderiaceae bacterium]
MEAAFWSGRLALQVASEPPESLSGRFELSGNAGVGQLHLFSPLGQTLAALHWAPGDVRLQAGGQERRFDSTDAMTRQLTGTALPLAALFGWLAGQPSAAPGWDIDLSRHADGRLQAQRSATDAAPAAQLRIILDTP